ncbi:hypothetical protein C84B14_13914 [Salinisphaera sp. C84B14]|uniref:baeRF3 domain-containing protein n=1 Tax=Salinisphaera sp. C84B14 TaxID=1304155 RepID=UPI003342E19F
MTDAKDNESPETHAPMLQWRDISALTLADESPCVTIYVPTTPVSNYREENRILYKDQVKKVGEALEQRDMDKYERDALLEQLESVGANEVFWTHQQYGLAVFASPKRLTVRRMMTRPAEAQGIVADSFHLRPALRAASNWMDYQVLCVSVQDVALYDANQDAIVEVDLHSEVPRGMGDALGKPDTSPNRKDSESAGSNSTDLKNYFKEVDKAIRAYHGKTIRPLVLAAVAEHQGLYREVSEHPNLLENGLNHDPFEAIRQSNLGEQAWEIAERATRDNIEQVIERYNERAAHKEGASALEEVAYSATIGQIDTLLIDETARVEGSVDSNGRIAYGAAGDGYTDDVLDKVAEFVIASDGDVKFVPGHMMPTDTGVAAVLRYAMEPQT